MDKEQKSEIHITNNFNAPIGQHINHVDTIHFHMEGDGTFHFGSVENAHVEGQREQDVEEPVLRQLDELMEESIRRRPKSPKHILLPVRAAKDAEVLPMANLDWVNERYGLKLNRQNWCDWVSKEDANYDTRELPPLVERFRALKNPKM